ncbi:MAG TPA: cytochrome c [Pirellulales bacterium]|nr:cytochrome c [Pirellulales bacterium]
MSLVGCQQEMGKQPAFRPLEPSGFFADGRSARPLVTGTIARGQLETDVGFFTGRRERAPQPEIVAAAGQEAGKPTVRLVNPDDMASYVDNFPFAMTTQILDRGRERFTIYCAVCHGTYGYGDGIVVRRGFKAPPSYHIDRLRDAPVGYVFAVATYGYGAMADYAEQVAPRDRWAIVAYIRALQLSQRLKLADLSADERGRIIPKLEADGSGPK